MPLGVPPEEVVPLGVLVAAVLVLLVVVVAVVLAVAAGMGNSIPAVCNILPKLVSNLAGLLVDLLGDKLSNHSVNVSIEWLFHRLSTQ